MRRAPLPGAPPGWVGVHQPARPGAPTVVALHGFTGTSLDWSEVYHHLPRAWGLLAPDLPGHGRSALSVDRPFALDGTLDALACVVAAATEGPRLLLGYSLGGRLALSWITRPAHGFDAVVTVGASPGLSSAAERDARRAADVELAGRIVHLGTRAFLDEWNAGPLFDALRRVAPTVRRRVRAHRREAEPASLAAALVGLSLGAMPPVHDTLARVTVPALFTAGALDPRYLDLAAAMAARTPGAASLAVQGAGHAAHLEAPKALAEHLVEFWKGAFRPA
jgi:2-succinyl-6-hydroxy-2,4-cyclohexadiene-1-carboxylate synthase